MELAADESVDAPIIEALRRRGYVVFSIAEQMAGATDKQVLEFANSSKALLLTGDKDFGELVFRQRLLSVGVVLVRLAGLSPTSKAELVGDVFQKMSDSFPGRFSVIGPDQVRQRPLLRSVGE